MNDTTIVPVIEKSTWGDGPWMTEPDRAEWAHVGLPCLALRSRHGNWCGYVAVPPSHPCHGQPYQLVDVDVHGGLTYDGPCRGAICHVPKPGEPDDVHWFGFDCYHAWDRAPGMEAYMRSLGQTDLRGSEDVYRTLHYVRQETNRLAEQLRAMESR